MRISDWSSDVCSSDLKAIILGVLHIMIDFGRAQQRLGRDAAPVEANAAEILALDDRRLEPELRRTDGRDIAARSRAEADEVVVGVSHVTPPVRADSAR